VHIKNGIYSHVRYSEQVYNKLEEIKINQCNRMNGLDAGTNFVIGFQLDIQERPLLKNS
jgi:hypothetical protein